MSLENFRSSLDGLSKSNRWVILGDNLPWVEIEKVYNSRLNNSHVGARNKPARMVVGALIIKHKLTLSDEETIWAIQENPYMQYMLGLSEFTDKPVFDPSLFVTIRKRLKIDDLNSFTLNLMQLKHTSSSSSTVEDDEIDDSIFTPNQSGDCSIDSQVVTHDGVLKLDATCCDAEGQLQKSTISSALLVIFYKPALFFSHSNSVSI